MNPVDWVLIGALIVFAWAGWRQGFVAGALSFTGFLGGALAGAFLLPGLIEERIEPGLARSLTLAGAILVCAAGGQVLLSYLGRTLRTGITWNPARLVDSAAGAGLNVLALAIVTWIIATAVAFLPQSSVTSQIRNSGVLVGLDSLVPDAVRNGFGQVRDAVGATAVPRIFSGLGEISGPDVQPADPLAADIAAIDDARGSIVRVTGSAAACRSSFSGSGFVIADGYVLTNAHVVAGVRMPALQVTRTFTLLRVCGFKLPQCKVKPNRICRSNKPNRGRHTRQSANGVPEVLDLRNFTCHNLSSSQFPRPLSAMILFV